MRKGFWSGLGLFAVVLSVAACGGGGGSGAVGVRPTTPPQSVVPVPTSSGIAIQGHWFIGPNALHASELVPAGQPAVLPPGGIDGGGIAHAIVIYPDGSKQIADANGYFNPSASSYALAHQKLLQGNALAQPQVILVDPLGINPPTSATVTAYQSASTLIARQAVPGSGRHLKLPFASVALTQTNLAGITLLPQQGALFSGGLLFMNVLGTDANNNVVNLNGATITWSANSGTISTFAGNQSAYYLPPAFGGGTLNDQVSVTVQVGSDPNNVFYASTPVTVVSQGSIATVTGTLTVNGTPAPQGLAVFAQPGPSQLFSPTLWLGQADANGNYTAQLPALSQFGLGIGVPDALSPSGSFGIYVATQPNGSSSYASGPQGSTQSLPLVLGAGAIPFSFVSPYDLGSVPSYVSSVRNAWYDGYETFIHRIFQANSGIQRLLSNQPTSFPSAIASVGSGQFSHWCYQWQSISGTPSLVVVENSNSTCTSPGNEAYVVQSTGTGMYAYAHYASNTDYVLSGTVDVITNSLLVESGNWSQTLVQDTQGNITSDQASLTADYYDINNQTLGSPVYAETLAYAYSLGSGGLSSEQFTNDTRTSLFGGATISIENATVAQDVALGASGCQAPGTTQACFTVTGSEKVDVDGSGSLDGSFSISDTFNGDGSGQVVFQSTSAGDSSKIVLPLAADVYGNSHNCIVCSTNLGQIYDTDGVTYIGTIEIDNTRLVKVIIYDTTPGSSTLGPDPIDSLGFVL